MYPLASIIEFILVGVGRMPANERAETLCMMFARLLPDMSEMDIAASRQQVISRFWTVPEIAEPVVDLLDGHLALRSLLRDGIDDDESNDWDEDQDDYEV